MIRLGNLPKYSVRFWGIALIFVSSLLYLLFQGGKLAFMLFIIVAALCLYFALCRWNGITRMKIVRTLPGARHEPVLEAGQPLAVNIQLHIPGFWPVPYVKIRERLVSLDGQEHVIEALGVPNWKRRVEVSYRTSPLRRGFYQFVDIECMTEDIFGLFKHRGSFGLPYTFAVLPQKVHIREWNQLQMIFQGGHRPSAHTRFHRETMQTSGVREFVNGDRLSRIHWNATAKTGTWKSKEFERESLPRLVLVLDRNKYAYPNKEQFELAVSTAASLLDYASSRNLAIGMLSAGKCPKYFEPKISTTHQKTIATHLIDVMPDSEHPLADVLQDWTKLLAPGIFLIVISSQFGDGMVQSLSWSERRQMKTCHMWIARDVLADDREKWSRHLRTMGIPGYAITSLDELAKTLGGH